jgi:uncharacterized protein
MYERLVAVHNFPGTYIFKVIGDNSQDFVSRVVQAAINVMGKEPCLEVSTRSSSAGRHVSVTLSADVEDAEMVLDIYEMLRVVQGVRFLV